MIDDRNLGAPGLPLSETWEMMKSTYLHFISRRQFSAAASRGPVRLDLHGSFDSGCVVTEAGPRPVFWFGDESANNWIAVDIAELFDAHLFVVYVEVVVAWQPERPLSSAN